MMKKIIFVFVAGMMILSGLGTAAVTNETTTKTTDAGKIVETIEKTISVDIPTITAEGDYIKVSTGDDLFTLTQGQPQMPIHQIKIILPFGSKNVQVQCIPKDKYEMEIEGKIVPGPTPVAYGDVVQSLPPVEDATVYMSNEFYPEKQLSYRTFGGLDSTDTLATILVINFVTAQWSPNTGMLKYCTEFDVDITYDEPSEEPQTVGDIHDLLIITSPTFVPSLRRLVRHKEQYGIRTKVVTVDSIYEVSSGCDHPEKIKYYIKEEIEEHGTKYVLLFGGLKSLWDADDKDSLNEGFSDWHVPVRYTAHYDDNPLYDPDAVYDAGYISDQYYADIYDGDGEFSSWDPNDDGVFSAWNCWEYENDVGIDYCSDVYVGRLACRNIFEARIMINKIINYEKRPANPAWFNKIITVSGDGFQDQNDLNIQWDTNDLPDGDYTLYAQSKNSDDEYGRIDEVNIELNRNKTSSITFSEDDHLNIDHYPAPPVAEITSPSEGDILGNTNFSEVPAAAYIGSRWAELNYTDGIMYIRGKAYDPQPNGGTVQITVRIENALGEEVFNRTKSSKHTYEGEKETELGANNLPRGFKTVHLWSSNGRLNGMDDVISAVGEGCGFLYFAGHGNPNVWANHYPGIPGGRHNSSIYGIKVINYVGSLPAPPIFPMNKFRNGYKLPVTVVGGCHNSQFNVSFMKTLNDHGFKYWTHGFPVPETFSWWLTRIASGGSIATIGSTGLGYGYLGSYWHYGLGGWINPEFFRQYNEEGHHVLGAAHGQTITAYSSAFSGGMFGLSDADMKTMEEWALLGDPSLMIGGYQ